MNDLLLDKKTVYTAMRRVAESLPSDINTAIDKIYHKEATWRGSHPLNELSGAQCIAETVWRPLILAMPDMERRDIILIGGDTKGCRYIGMVGHLLGTFHRPWLGIPPTGKSAYLRYGEFHHVVDGKIAQSTVLFDVLDFIRQAGFWPLAPSLGTEALWPCPLNADGIILSLQSEAQSAASIALVLSMHKALQDYDDRLGGGRDGLLNMPQKNFWHPKMMWYGPAGIGIGRGLDGFVDVHQLPFRRAFPNRLGVGHYVRIGDGEFAATGGWPSVQAMDAGGGWCGLPPTNRSITMRVMDFYWCDGNLIRENWVPLDMLNVLLQMDVDVFARLKEAHPNFG